MNSADVIKALRSISASLTENCDRLTELDQAIGDGDLGVSMRNGFEAVVRELKGSQETNLGLLIRAASSALNENSPSTLGTVLSIMMIGMAKSLKGKSEASLAEYAEASKAGMELVMRRADSRIGEKTILDAIYPAVEALNEKAGDGWNEALKAAAEAAAAGSENTRTMKAQHGRAAYYGEKSIGMLDGGSVVGRLIFEAIYKCALND